MYARSVTTPLQARVQAAAAVTGISVEALLSHLGDVVGELADVEVGTNADATAIGVSVGLLADPYLEQRLSNLANAISGSQALARSAVARRSRVMRAERGVGPKGRPTRGLAGVFSSLYHLEPRSTSEDLALARSLGIPAAVERELGARLATVGASATTLRVTVYAGPTGEDMQLELGAPAPADVFARIGDTSEASRFLRALEPRGTQFIWFGARPAGVLPYARIEYVQPDLEEAIVIAGKFGEMNRAQAFVSALDARSAASISVTLGTSPLGPAWLTANT